MYSSRPHDDVIKWKHYLRYWPFVRGIHRPPVNSPHKCQWRGALVFSFIYTRINGWENNRKAGDLRRHRDHYDVIVMQYGIRYILGIMHMVHPLMCFVVVWTETIIMTSSNGNIFRVTGPLCGEFTGPGDFPAQWPVTRSFDVFFDLGLNKRLSKQPWGWWFETPPWSLWRQCNVIPMSFTGRIIGTLLVLVSNGLPIVCSVPSHNLDQMLP